MRKISHDEKYGGFMISLLSILMIRTVKLFAER